MGGSRVRRGGHQGEELLQDLLGFTTPWMLSLLRRKRQAGEPALRFAQSLTRRDKAKCDCYCGFVLECVFKKLVHILNTCLELPTLYIRIIKYG